MADFEITLIFDNCHIKSNPCFSAGPTGCCYLLKLPIQDFEQEDGVYSAAAFPFRDVRPREKPANGTLAYYICKAQCPGTGGTGFWLIPHMFQMMQESQKNTTLQWENIIHPAIKNQFEDFKIFGKVFLLDYDIISNMMDEEYLDYDMGFSMTASLIQSMEERYYEYRKGIYSTIQKMVSFKTDLFKYVVQITSTTNELKESDEDTAEAFELMNNFELFSMDLEKRRMSINILQNELAVVIKQCLILAQKWNGVESEFNELVTASDVPKDSSPQEKREKFKHLYLKLDRIQTKWQEMVVLSNEVAEFTQSPK